MLMFACFIQINREGVLLLRGLDSRLSKDLPSDLQKLRCKVLRDNIYFSFVIISLLFQEFIYHNSTTYISAIIIGIELVLSAKNIFNSLNSAEVR